MKYYDQLLEQMTNYYINLVACAPDQASDVMIRLRVLAAQLDTYCPVSYTHLTLPTMATV